MDFWMTGLMVPPVRPGNRQFKHPATRGLKICGTAADH
jgi:hypothetical protein